MADAVSPYGNTITSADVEWTFDRILELDGVGRFLMSIGAFDSENPVEVIDERTFDIKVTDPNNPYTLAILTYGDIGPLDSAEVLSHATEDDPWGAEWLSTNSASFGPYWLEEIIPGEQLTLVKNPNWWDVDSLDINRIVIRAVPDSASRLQLVTTGEVDFADKLSLDQFAAVQGDPSVQTIAGMGNTTVPLVLNMGYEPYADGRVRAAISIAIDRSAIIAGPMQGFGAEALHQVLSEVPQPAPTRPPVAYDPDGARALLAEAGYGDGLEFVLTVNPVRPGPFSEDIAVLIKSQLADVGVNVDIQVVASAADFQTALMAGEYQAWIGSQTPGISDPQFAWVLVHHSTKAFENAHGYSNPRVDELLDLMAVRGEEDAILHPRGTDLQRLPDFDEFAHLVASNSPRAWHPAFAGFKLLR